LLVAGLLLQAGCGALTGFSCLDDSQCRNGGREGECVAGYCAYPDTTCETGLRWSTAAAEDFADRCVDIESTSTLATTTDTSSSSGQTEPASESTTIEPPMPYCGDGIIDDGEECDPALVDPDGRHCNAECVISGRLLGEFTWDHAGNDAALGVALWDGDIAVAGYAEWSVEGQGYDVHVARHSPDGEPRWTFRMSGSALKNDYARAVIVTEADTVRIAGHIIPDEGEVDREQTWLGEVGPEGTLVWESSVGTPVVTDSAMAMALIDQTDFIVVGRAGAGDDFSIQRYSLVSGEVTLVWEQLVAGLEMEVDLANTVAMRDNVLIYAGGYTRPSATDRDRYLASWLLDGTPSPIPCDTGEHPRPVDGADEIRGLSFRPDGSLAAVGIGQQGATQDAWIGLYAVGTCELGWQRFEGSEEGHDAFAAVAVDAQGNVIAGGWLRDGTNDNTWLVAWSGDDELEILWQAEPENGPGDGDDRINALVIDEDGTIVVAGQNSQPTDTDVWVGRYTP
jgi:hypothetical protein